MLLWADDFGRFGATESLMTDGLYAQVDTGSDAWSLDTTNPRTGTRSLRLGPNMAAKKLVRRIFGSAKTNVGVGYAWYAPELPDNEGFSGDFGVAWCLFDFRDATNQPQFQVILGTDGGIQIYRNSIIEDNSGYAVGLASRIDLGRSDPCVAAGSWNLIQCFARADASSGEIEVRVNGATVVTVSGVATVNTANIEYSQVVFGTANGTGAPFAHGTTTAVDIADLHAWDDSGSYNNDFPGDNKAFLSMPNGDSGPSDWTRSAGANNYALIDEIPPDEATSYLTSSTPGDQVQVETENLPVPAVAVAGVVGWFRAKKTDAGDCTIRIGVVSNGTTEWGAAHTILTGYRYFETVFETDPDTGLPWTSAAIDDAKLIFERVT